MNRSGGSAAFQWKIYWPPLGHRCRSVGSRACNVSNANYTVGAQIVSELDAIRNTLAPVSVPAYTLYFASTMQDALSFDGRRLSVFISYLPLYALRNVILRLVLDDEAQALLVQHDEITRLKENAIAEQQFELAARLRDAQCELHLQLNRLVQSSAEVHPIHILEAIRDLGFDGALPIPR